MYARVPRDGGTEMSAEGGAAGGRRSLQAERSLQTRAPLIAKARELFAERGYAAVGTAEIVRDYVKKGSKLYVEGKIQTRSWDDKDTGAKRYRTEIIVNDMSLLSGREDGGEHVMARALGAELDAQPFGQEGKDFGGSQDGGVRAQQLGCRFD